MRKIINLFFVFLILFSLANAITPDEREDILRDLNLARGSEGAFRSLLNDLNNRNMDLSGEKEIKSIIKEKADYFSININKEYLNIKMTNYLVYILVLALVVLLAFGVFVFIKMRGKNEI